MKRRDSFALALAMAAIFFGVVGWSAETAVFGAISVTCGCLGVILVFGNGGR